MVLCVFCNIYYVMLQKLKNCYHINIGNACFFKYHVHLTQNHNNLKAIKKYFILIERKFQNKI